MRILGLDPGSLHTGYGAIEVERGRLRLVEAGVLSCPRRSPLPARLARMAAELAALVERLAPAAAVLETPFHGPNPRSLIVLAQARGALLASLGDRGLEVLEYSPAEVKSAVTGNGRAGKDQVAKMVRVLLGMERRPGAAETLPSDATDALAVAICAAHRFKMDRISALDVGR